MNVATHSAITAWRKDTELSSVEKDSGILAQGGTKVSYIRSRDKCAFGLDPRHLAASVSRSRSMELIAAAGRRK